MTRSIPIGLPETNQPHCQTIKTQSQDLKYSTESTDISLFIFLGNMIFLTTLRFFSFEFR